MSQRNAPSTRPVRKSAQEFPRKPSLSVRPTKAIQPKVSKIMPRELSTVPFRGDTIPGERALDSQMWADIPSLAITLVEHASLHFLTRVTPIHSEQDRAVMNAVLQYLNTVKEATPRRLGAFSFLVTRGTPLYLSNGTHFAHENPSYMGIYASFGGDMKASISEGARSVRLSNISPIPSRNIRPQEFSTSLLSLIDEGIAFYAMPVPTGADFDAMQPIKVSEYISAGIGPRMLFDFSGKMSDSVLQEIIARCWEARVIAPHIHLFDQLKLQLSHIDLDFPSANDIAVLTHDGIILDAIEQYGESFRLAYLSGPQMSQVLGLPFGVSLSDGARNVLVGKLITGDERSDKYISPFALSTRAALITKRYIAHQKDLVEMSMGSSCKLQYHLTDPDSVYSCVDIFTYCTIGGDGCTLHVVSSDQLPALSVGQGAGLDDSIEWEAIERWDYMEDNDLFPAVDIRDMLRSVTHPSLDWVNVLNSSAK